MLRGIGWLLAVFLLAAGCWWMYGHVKSGVVPANGDVLSRNEPSDPKDSGANLSRDASTAAVSIPAAEPAPAAPTASTPQPPTAQEVPAPIPASDTLPPDPVNGMPFGGSGKYQWYRQGNLTWRIDTRDGTSCIDFATMEEWNKPVVYSHGCAGSRRSRPKA
jgi:hypothetical protein